MAKPRLIGHCVWGVQSTILVAVGLVLSAETNLASSFDRTLALAVGNLTQVAVRDGRGSLARDLAITLLGDGKRCDQAIGLLRANPDALATNADQVADAAVRSGDAVCLIKVAAVLAKAAPPADGSLPSTAPEAHHLAGVLLTVAGRSEGKAIILQAEAAMAAALPPLPSLGDTASPQLRALIGEFQLLARMQEKLSGRTLADERVWNARDTELSIYASSPRADGRYATTLDRYASAALAAGPKVPAGTLDDIATRCLDLGRRDRASALMDAAVRNEDSPNVQHSLASREVDTLLKDGKYPQAAARVNDIDPAKAPVLVDLALTEIMLDQPETLLPQISAFNRWSGGQPARVAEWSSLLALQLAGHGSVSEARASLVSALGQLKEGGTGQEWNTARATAAQAAALLGQDDTAWSLASNRRADPGGYVGLVSSIALGALHAGRDASADRALVQLSREEQGYVYERILSGAPGAPVKARQRIVERMLAFAAKAEALQGRRIYASLVEEAAGQLDLPDMVVAIISAAPPAERGSLAVNSAFRAFVAAEVAGEKGQTGAEAEGRRRQAVLTQIAVTELANLSDDDKLKLSQQLCTGLHDPASSRRVADAVVDPNKREQAYVTLVRLNAAAGVRATSVAPLAG